MTPGTAVLTAGSDGPILVVEDPETVRAAIEHWRHGERQRVTTASPASDPWHEFTAPADEHESLERRPSWIDVSQIVAYEEWPGSAVDEMEGTWR